MKILVVDDHPIVRDGLHRLLADEPDVELCDAESGKQALALFRQEHPDLVIVDLNLPGFGGLELIKRLTLEKTTARILVLSMHDEPIYAMCALQVGAAGYVSKNAPPAQLLEAIRRVAEGRTYLGHELAQELALLNLRAPSHPLEELSPRDLELLRLLAEGSSLQEIADTLGLSYKTVANNFSQMKAKLGVKRTADLIRIALRNDLAVIAPAVGEAD
jgi:two-component system, NarL family, invasion response regulator UvrY